MAGRPKKINTEESKEINMNVITKEVNKDEVNQESSNSNDLFSPENMAKMFAMFKQFENMNSKEEAKTQTLEKTTEQKTKFSKVMLSKISDEIITVRSVIDNVNFLSPKTQTRYKWLQKGDVEPLTVAEILAMENVSRRFLHTPWLVVEDERIIQALDLQRTYDLIKKVEDINELIKLNKSEIETIFNELPPQYQNNFRNEIYKKVKTRELNNLSTIDNLGEILKIDLKNI